MHSRPLVLIIDDQPENIEVLGETLADICDISFALSGAEGLALLESSMPDLILLDVMMPGMDGYKVIDILQGDPRTCDVPVIFVTARTDAESETRALAAGAKDFIHKPINQKVVQARIRTQLQSLQQRRELQSLNQQLSDSLSEMQATQRQLLILRTAIEQSPVSVVVTNSDTAIEYVNPSFRRVTGYTEEEALGHNPNVLKSGLTDPMVYKDLWDTLTSGKPWTGELINRTKAGTTYVEEAHIAPVKDEQGVTTHYVGIKMDITERKKALERLDYLAHYDALTNLPNRGLFFDRVKQGLALAQRHEQKLAVLFLDLDKFKPINDTWGHAVGDLVLQEAARRMEACLRVSDTVGRMGGDEFVILLLNIHSVADAMLVGEKIRRALNDPFVIDGHTLHISSCQGVALYPEHGRTAMELAKHADSAMYQAKDSGRDKVMVFDPAMTEGQ